MKRNSNDRGAAATMERPQGVQDEHPTGKTAASNKEMKKRAEDAARPGPGHKALEHFVGDWKAEVKCWAEPGGPPHTSKATAKGSWTMNGRFLQEDFTGEMMGTPFHGRTLMGYDNVKEMFTSVWISDVQTSMFKTEGKGDVGNKVITLDGTASCPMRQRGDIPMRLVLRVLGPDKHTFEMFDCSQTRNAKTMEITYTRA